MSGTPLRSAVVPCPCSALLVAASFTDHFSALSLQFVMSIKPYPIFNMTLGQILLDGDTVRPERT